LIQKADTTFFAALILTTVLLIAFDSSAFAQGERRSRDRQSEETASQAEAVFLNALLLSDDEDGQPARLQLQDAIGLWMQIRQPGKAAMAAFQVGDRYKKARKYQDALDYYRRALEIRSIPGVVRANALNSIALIYADLYLHDLARHYFRAALSQARTIKDLPAEVLALTGLADFYRHQGALEQAMSYITRALRLTRKDLANADPALLILKGRVCQEQGLIEDAKGAFEEALAICQTKSNTEGQVRVLCAMSSLSLLASQKQTALEQAKGAVDLAEDMRKHVVSDADEINSRELRWRAWLSRAHAELSLGQKDRALDSYSRAIAHSRAIWWEFYIVTEASAVAFREEVQAAYREYVELLMEDGQFNKAYDLADEAKSRTLLNFIGARRRRLPSGDSKQAETQRELFRSVTHQRLLLLAQGLTREQQAKAQKEIEDTEFKMDETRLRAEMEHFKERLVWSKLAAAGQVRAQMAEDQMTLAEFCLGEKRSFLWLFTRGEVFFEILPARKKIENEVRTCLDMLGAPPSQLYIERDLARLRDCSGALFNTLFGRLSQQIEPGQRLLIVPDGLLHYLPFEALIHNGHYLVEDHEMSYLPSASILLQLQDSRSEVETGDRMELLAFGDPIFSPDLKASLPKKHKSIAINVVRNARASLGFQLTRLPRTRDEVEYIAGLFSPDRTRLYLGEDSTEDAVKRESLRRYRRLHFATHSLIDEKSPARSAVVLTLDSDPGEDGFLEASEISELDLDCDLVVLSACQTGRGQLLSGEGVVGLTRAFLYAGARSVVVSLWSVSDISTGQLMKDFYRNLADNLGSSAALRLAKLEMSRSVTQTRHPYYWAPFIAIGKPSAYRSR
jgi:CHAT domain-containing protein